MPTTQQAWKNITNSKLVLTANQLTARLDASGTDAAGPAALVNESGVFLLDGDSSKLRVYGTVSGGTVAVRINGWTFNEEEGIWMPEILAKATGTFHTVGRTIDGVTMFPVISWNIDAGTGNARTTSGAGQAVPASLLFDHQGNRWGEAAFTATVATSVFAYRKNV